MQFHICTYWLDKLLYYNSNLRHIYMAQFLSVFYFFSVCIFLCLRAMLPDSDTTTNNDDVSRRYSLYSSYILRGP